VQHNDARGTQPPRRCRDDRGRDDLVLIADKMLLHQ